MKTEANNPAYPTDIWRWSNECDHGLTKLEWFTGMAMQGLLANPSVGVDPTEFAIQHAQSLIKKLNETGENLALTKKNKRKMKTPEEITKAISGLSAEAKNKLFAIWMSKERLKGSKTLDIMFALDDEWERVFQENRIKEGFSAAALRANERLLTIVYGG